MNIEQVCKDAIKVVECYLANGAPAYDRYDELYEAMEAVDKAWDVNLCEAGKYSNNIICRAAWHACEAAKNDKDDLAKIYVAAFWRKFWEQVWLNQ